MAWTVSTLAAAGVRGYITPAGALRAYVAGENQRGAVPQGEKHGHE